MGASECHIRRCHLCGHLLESRKPIDHCESCDKAISPFYYFNEKKVFASENQLRNEGSDGEYRPLLGLSAVWDE
jgi:hypothetical protein